MNWLAGLSDTEIASRYGWAFTRLGIRELWDSSMGAGVSVAVIDSGIRLDHPAFIGTELEAKNCWGTGAVSDYDGHGTAVCSIVAAANPAFRMASGRSILGVAPRAKLLSTLMNVSPVDPDQAADAIDWSAKMGADILVASWGLWKDPPYLSAAVARWLDSGGILVACAGNSKTGSTVSLYPAAYPGVVVVGPSNQNDQISAISAHNASTRYYAPGEAIHIATLPNQVGLETGSSFAAPLVAGVIALLFSWALSAMPGSARPEIQRLILGALDAKAAPLSTDQRGPVACGVIRPIEALSYLKEQIK